MRWVNSGWNVRIGETKAHWRHITKGCINAKKTNSNGRR